MRRKRDGSVSVPRGMRTQFASDSVKLAENWSFFFDELRDELLVEILIRLPSIDAVRFKAVCKRWCDLISDRDYFITRFLHHRHLLQADRPFSLVFQTRFSYVNPLPFPSGRKDQVEMISENQFRRNSYKCRIIDMRFIPCVQHPLPFKPMMTGPMEFEFEASCADLLLCSYNNPSTYLTVYHICNMVTREWVALPPVRMDSMSADVGFLIDQGQAQSELSGRYNYRIVRLPRARTLRVPIHFKLEIQIFSSEEGGWTNSVVPLPRCLNTLLASCRMAACNRMLHMLTPDGVIVFDPFRETQQVISRIIDLPVKNVIRLGTEFCLGTSRGQVRLSIIMSSTLDIWDLEDYKNGKWCMAHKIRIKDIERRFKWELDFYVIAFHPNDENIMYLATPKYVVECYLQQENKLKVIYRLKRWKGMCGGGLTWHNTFPLVHHWWPLPLL